MSNEKKPVVNSQLTPELQDRRTPSALEDVNDQIAKKSDQPNSEETVDPTPAPTPAETSLPNPEPDPVPTPEPVKTPEPTPDPKPGSQTPPEQLLSSLQDEREKRRELEKELESLKSSAPPEDDAIFSDEGQALQKQIKEQNAKIANLEKDKAIASILATYPVMKDHLVAFDEYCALHKGMDIIIAAKAFVTEKGLLEAPRVGLEDPTGGEPSTATSTKMTAAEAKHLRETDFKEYQKKLQNGEIPDKFDS